MRACLLIAVDYILRENKGSDLFELDPVKIICFFLDDFEFFQDSFFFLLVCFDLLHVEACEYLLARRLCRFVHEHIDYEIVHAQFYVRQHLSHKLFVHVLLLLSFGWTTAVVAASTTVTT